MNDEDKLTALETVEQFYSLLLDEIAEVGYSSQELSLLWDQTGYYGRYLNMDVRNYFIQTVMPHIAQAILYFELNKRENVTMLDLGCGLGMQSLIFAGLGAKVKGVDKSERCISLCWKRKAHYEKKLKTSLDIDFQQRDFGASHSKSFRAQFDCAFSMSAFSYMRPAERTVSLLTSILKRDAQIYLYEANSAYLLRLLKSWSEIRIPKDIVNLFENEGYHLDFLYGGCAISRWFWSLPSLNCLMVALNELMRKSLHLSFNYVLGMRRQKRF